MKNYLKNTFKNYLKKRNKNKNFQDFHNASYNELKETPFYQNIYSLPRIKWTPNISLINPSLEFMEFLEDCNYQKKYDIFNPLSSKKNIKSFVENFIIESFNKKEIENLEIKKDIKFETNENSPFWGQIDFIIKNKKDEFVIILIPEKNTEFDIYEGYFKLQTISALVIIDFFFKSFPNTKKINVLLTNGHQWQFFEYFNYKVKRTKTISSSQKIINYDFEVVQSVLGIIRYAVCRYENELLLDDMLESFDDHKFLEK